MREFKFESNPANKYKRRQSKYLNKYYDKNVSRPFFLTRQSANLMEDFTRELNQGSALFLLYGDTGVGKTRLLQELSQSRLSERAVFWLDLDSGDGNDETRMDRSTEVEALFAAAGNGDIIIADHFEMALKKTRHQMLLSWSTDGIDKQLNLIIASSTEGFEELRQLSQQYQVPVQSFQLMPFSADEVQAFLGFYLFPDHPLGKLTMPAALAKQIAAAQGIVGRVIEIVEREGAQIQSTAPVPAESVRPGGKLIFALLFLVALALGIGWYLLDQPETSEIPSLAMTEPDKVNTPLAAPEVEVDTQPLDRSEVALEAQSAPISDTNADSTVTPVAVDTEATTEDSKPVLASAPTVDLESSAAQITASENSAEAAMLAATEAVMQAQPTAAGMAQEPALSAAEPGTASDSEAVIVEQPAPAQAAGGDTLAEPPASPRTSQERFDLELRQSLDWIGKRDDSVGTIQILLLSYANFDPDNYYNFVANLARKQVDTGRLRVFKTYTGNREVYSVVYGEYASRKAALGAIDSLPAVLRDTSPLARSVGGLWQEIRRLESIQ